MLKCIMKIDNIKKYCQYILIGSDWLIYPKDEIKQYWNNLKCYSYVSEDNIMEQNFENVRTHFVCFEIQKEILPTKEINFSYGFLESDDMLVFEFETEEDAFYFQLKFC